MAKKPGFAAKLIAMPIPKRKPTGWFEQIVDESIKDELRELHKAIKSGQVKHTQAYIREAIKNDFKIDVGEKAFSTWIKRATPDG